MCMYGGHMCICIPNMKFLCLNLCQGEVCTDANTSNAGCRTQMMQDGNDDGQCIIVLGSLVEKPNEPIKSHFLIPLEPRKLPHGASEIPRIQYIGVTFGYVWAMFSQGSKDIKNLILTA